MPDDIDRIAAIDDEVYALEQSLGRARANAPA